MGMSHATCNHPRTPAGRAACRKSGGPGFAPSVTGATMARPIITRLDQVQALAVELMNRYGLVVGGWRFVWDSSRRRFGQCRYMQREIGISRYLAEVNDVDTTRDTILHEIAHALTPGHNHDEVWQRMAAHIGAKPNRYYSTDEVAPAKGSWIGTCSNGHTVRRARRPRTDAACTRCCRTYNWGKWHADYLITWKQV